MKKIITAVILLAFSIPAYGQTIHKDDITRFYGSFAIDSTVEVNRGRGGKPAPIITDKFEEWFVLAPGEKDRLTAQHRKENREQYRYRHWVSYNNHVDNQSRKVYPVANISSNKIWYEFHMLTEYSESYSSRNVLSVWERVEGTDSIIFKYAFTGPFDNWFGFTTIEFATLMPDNSLVVIIRNSGGEGGDWNRNYSFLIETDNGKFEEFYSRGWSFHEGNFHNLYKYYYLFEMMSGNSFKFLEIGEYYHETEDKMTGMRVDKISDSNVVKSIDLEELIKQHFESKE